ALVSHVVQGQRQAVALLADEPAATNAPDDLPAAWDSAAAAAAAAWNAPGALDREVVLPFGRMTATGYLERRVVDLTVHAWDLARAIGDGDDVPNDLAGVVLEIVQRREDELVASGRFGTSMSTVSCADDLAELLARLGRARWKTFAPATFTPAAVIS
ncbi:MAG: maleylpyruvate isomerase N-terminal domain-containing protein, partial [Nakamurella sp.]